MRVVVNQLASLGQKAGIGHYTAELLRCMREHCSVEDAGDEIEDYPTGWLRRAGRTFKRARSSRIRNPKFEIRNNSEILNRKSENGNCLGPGFWASNLFRISDFGFRISAHWGRTLAAHRFRAACRQRHYDLYHEPNFIPFPCDCPTVVTIPDLSVLLHPEWHPADRVAYFEKNFQRGLAQGSHFLAISEFGRQEIIRILNIAPTRVTRTYMGIRRGLGPLSANQVGPILARLGLPSQYLLYLGTIEPRKNLLRLLKAYCALPQELRSRWPLLLVGGWGWNTADIADYFHNEARHRGVIHLGYVKDRYLGAVYNGARALVYPSLYEGFGLPPLEMMACGGAVIASTAGALAETIGTKAHLVEPEDLDGWKDAMARVIRDEDWQRSLRQGAPDVARPYTWDRCAAETLAVYRMVGRQLTFGAAG
jgi:alpha-1,3-rhamnosyl/mannosyltransferase